MMSPTRLAAVLSTLALVGPLPSAFGQGIVTQWNFNGATDGTLTPSVGAGTASLIGGTTAAFASGVSDSGSTDTSSSTAPPNFGWGVGTYPAASVGSGTAGARYDVSTAGNSNLVVRFDLRHTSTVSRFFRLDYTTDGTNFTPSTVFSGNLGANTWYNNRTVDLSDIGAANNNANFGVRVVSIFEPGQISYVGTSAGYTTAGISRFDMVTVTAGHVWVGGSGTGIGTAGNYSGGAAPGTTATVLFGTAGGANTAVTVGTTTVVDQVVFKAGAPSYTISGANTLTMNAGLVNNATNPQTISAPVAFGNQNTVQNNGGTLTLSGAVSFSANLAFQGTGTTLINGTVAVTSTGTVRVAPGATLGGSGTINRAITVFAITATDTTIQRGVITAGTASGSTTLTVGAALVINDNAAYRVQLFGTGATDISKIQMTGSNTFTPSTTLGSFSQLQLDLSGVDAASLRAAVGVGNSRVYTVVSGSAAGVTNFAAGALAITNLNGFQASEWVLLASPAAGTVQLQFTPVPEPAFVLGVAGGALWLGTMARRRVGRRTAGASNAA